MEISKGHCPNGYSFSSSSYTNTVIWLQYAFLPGIFGIRTCHRPSHTLYRLVELEHRETNHSHSLLGHPMPAILNCLFHLNVAPTNVRFAHEVIFVSTAFACWEARGRQQHGESNRSDHPSFWARAGLKDRCHATYLTAALGARYISRVSRFAKFRIP